MAAVTLILVAPPNVLLNLIINKNNYIIIVFWTFGIHTTYLLVTIFVLSLVARMCIFVFSYLFIPYCCHTFILLLVYRADFVTAGIIIKSLMGRFYNKMIFSSKFIYPVSNFNSWVRVYVRCHLIQCYFRTVPKFWYMCDVFRLFRINPILR